MRTDCDIIKDLLPLYAEGMVSDKSKDMIEEHFAECEACREIYKSMTAPEPQVQFHTEPAQSFKKYVKKKKWSFGWKVALVTALAVLAVVIARILALGGVIGLLMFGVMTAPVEVDTDVNHYEQYMGQDAKEEYRTKWSMDEGIFPAEITDEMNVKDYKMVYYNPWDAQYLSYLVVEYDKEAYDEEVNRLASYPSDSYYGYYGAEGFDEKYELLAMNADSYQGFVYALTDGESEIIYVEIIFCNYFMDLDYEKYIDTDYLPIGFDATMDNPYRKEKMGEDY